MATTEIDLSGLKKEIPFKYKPQTVKFGKAVIVSYIDARDVQDVLDDVVGPANWQSDYRVVNNNMFGGIGINTSNDIKNPNWVWKWDCGTESNVDKEKGESSDAFKRAGVQWGIGRFLYRQGMVTLKTIKNNQGKEVPCTDDGKILYGNDQITEYIRNNKLGKKTSTSKSPKYETPTSEPQYATKITYEESTIKRASSVEKDGKKGRECLKHFLPEFQSIEKKEYANLTVLNDLELNKLIDFIENKKPEGI